MVVLCSGAAVAEHGGTKAFERRNREAREATNGKVLSERLKVFWDDGAVYFRNEDGEGWWKVGLEDGKKETVDARPDTATEKKEKKRGRRPRPQGGRPLNKPESPDGAWRVRVKDGKVELTGESDKNGPKVLEIERPDGWVLEDRVLWSPNSDRFVVWRKPNTPVRQVILWLTTWAATSRFIGVSTRIGLRISVVFPTIRLRMVSMHSQRMTNGISTCGSRIRIR